MRAHFLQHVPFEGLSSIEAWLLAAGYRITATRFFESCDLPDPEQIDLLIVMGGPMSVNDEEHLPWLAPEKEFIRHAVAAGRPVLGICLGAQLIASSMGKAVYRNREKEIGWFPVFGTSHEDKAIFSFPPEAEVFHWHGETFDLPDGAIHLARSGVCENQAFQLGRSAIGLQFHLETTPQSAVDLVANCRDELQPSEYIQDEETILASAPEKYQAINSLMAEILAYLHRSGRGSNSQAT
jgi:GMP synthase-like glutamine amidotransferase